jgi:DNA-binding NarL/FixJ family response regulator
MNVMKNSTTLNSGDRRKRLLLIDDDPVASEILLLRIRQSCPLVTASVVHDPVAPPGYDIYVVDLNFGNRQEGVRLAESIATTTPGADVFLLSSFLDVEALKRAMGVQCSGAFDKRNREDVSALMRMISEVSAQEPPELAARPQRKPNLFSEMAALIREWNKRISAEQSRDR